MKNFDSKKLILNNLYRKFDRQTSDNSSFDAKMGILLGFFSLYFVGLIIFLIENPHTLSNSLFLIGFVTSFISVLFLIAAFYPIDYRDPLSIKDFFSKENGEKTCEKTYNKIVISYKDAYIFNASQLKRKSNLCKAGLAIFVISLFFLFISIIYTNMTSNCINGGEEETPSYDTVTKGDDSDNDSQPSYDIKTLNE